MSPRWLERTSKDGACRAEVTIEAVDVRKKEPDERFDVVTLYNNIYYFEIEDRVALLRHIKGFIKADGFLLLTTCCQGGSLPVEVLNLWGAATANVRQIAEGGRDDQPAQRRRLRRRSGNSIDSR